MAKFEKGHKRATGRPKGAANKVTLETKALIQSALDNNQERFNQELAALEGKDFVQMYMNLFEYIVPKLARQELTGNDGDGLTIIFKTATDADRNHSD